MRILLDTCTFLWLLLDAPQLSEEARRLFRDPDSDVLLSSVSMWEIAVKHSLGRLPLPESPERYVPRQRVAHGIASLPLDEAAALHVARLPDIHADPFDRMLICQSIVHGLVLLTPDREIARYPVPIAW